MDFILLLPPSEGKTKEAAYPKRKLTKEELQALNSTIKDPKLLKLKDKALQEAIAANKEAHKVKTLPAIERYTGVLFKALDYNTLTKQEKTRAQKHIAIFSGLFGLIQANENIPNYKYKVQLAKHLKPTHIKNKFVINLLPDAHAKYVTYDKGTRVDFYKNNKRAGHFAKHIKGRFVRYLIQNPPKTEKDLKKFKEEGFKAQKDKDILIFKS